MPLCELTPKRGSVAPSSREPEVVVWSCALMGELLQEMLMLIGRSMAVSTPVERRCLETL